MPAAIIDQYNGDPVYAHLHLLTKQFPLAREMLKTASFETAKSQTEYLPDSAFAWEEERRFPIHTREDALASIFYRSKVASAVPVYVDTKLSIAQAVYKLDASIFSPMKTASEKEESWALPDNKRLPLNNVSQIKMAEEVLHRDYLLLSLEKRAEAFSNLYFAATKHDVSLKPLSMKMAGVTIGNPKTIRDWLEARAEAAPNALHKAAYTKLAAAVDTIKTPIQERPSLVKLAATIAEIDKQAGLDKFYGRKLPDPLLTVFNTEKIAETTCDVAGAIVPASTLMQLPEQVWQQVDAPELAAIAQSGDEEQFQQIFATMPLDVKTALRPYVGNG